jgi:hypothetical protein
MTVDGVARDLLAGEFKPNSHLAMLDFLVSQRCLKFGDGELKDLCVGLYYEKSFRFLSLVFFDRLGWFPDAEQL